MTLSARPNEFNDRRPLDSQVIEIMVTSGPVTVTVDEPLGSARAFWAYLGEVLERADKAVEQRRADHESLG